MNILTRFLGWIGTLVVSTLATQAQTAPAPYALPDRFQFDYKVVQQINGDDGDQPKTQTLYFTKNGEYMATVADKDDSNTELTINTKDGYMITFGREIHDSREKRVGGPIYRNVVKVTDMRRFWQGAGKAILALGKTIPKKNKSTDEDDKPAGMMDNFQKTGHTKLVSGYQAEEYARTMQGEDRRAGTSGTLSVWYAHVDFDPSLMLGMGSMASPAAAQRLQATHPNNMLGIGMTQKNYLLVDISAAMTGAPTQLIRQVTSIEKTLFSKAIAGYYVKNYSGMSMEEMMKKEADDN